jgi:hypothetical protein
MGDTLKALAVATTLLAGVPVSGQPTDGQTCAILYYATSERGDRYEVRSACQFDAAISLSFVAAIDPNTRTERLVVVPGNGSASLDLSPLDWWPEWILVSRAEPTADAVVPQTYLPESCIKVRNYHRPGGDWKQYVMQNQCGACRYVVYRYLWKKPDDQIGKSPRQATVRLPNSDEKFLGEEDLYWVLEILSVTECPGSGGGVVKPPTKPTPGPVPVPAPGGPPPKPPKPPGPQAPRDLKVQPVPER